MSLPTAEFDQRLRWALWGWIAALAVNAVCVATFGDGVAVTELVVAVHGTVWHALLSLFTDYGMYVFYALFIIVLLVGWRRGDRRLRTLGWGYVLAQLSGSVLIVRSLKILTGHARPNALAPGAAGSHWIGPTMDASYHSFPSGHTADLFTGAIFVAVLARNPALRVLGFALAALVAFSRVALDKHYPTDVLAGLVIAGVVSLCLLAYWVRPRLRRDDVLGRNDPDEAT
ncbi:MAG TPA: phosphatase PAP2 family protein [Gammaproteobacteria bacterium]|nr:phosphatase PAP2 family protein [Gammaproteobacteria bacterium]